MNGDLSGDGSAYGSDQGYGSFTDTGLSSDSALFSPGYADPSAAFSGDLTPSFDAGLGGANTDFSASAGQPVDLGNSSTSSDGGGGLGSSILGSLESAGSFLGNIGSDLLSGIGYVGDAAAGGIGALFKAGASALGGSKGIGSLLGSVLKSAVGGSSTRGALTRQFGGYGSNAARAIPPAIPSTRNVNQNVLANSLVSRPTRSTGSYGTATGLPAPFSSSCGGGVRSSLPLSGGFRAVRF